MNYLAHIYLSRDHELISIGNFMADSIKGNKYKTYPTDLQKGILLHRQIDSFTDAHEIVRKSKRRLNDRYGLYRGVVIDIFYDHFLASLWDEYSDLPLQDFVSRTYDLLKRNYKVLPESIKRWFPTFLENNWMMTYRTVDGIELVLERMSANTSLPNHAGYAVDVLKEQYSVFEEDFREFFPLIVAFLEEKYQISIDTTMVNYPYT